MQFPLDEALQFSVNSVASTALTASNIHYLGTDSWSITHHGLIAGLTIQGNNANPKLMGGNITTMSSGAHGPQTTNNNNTAFNTYWVNIANVSGSYQAFSGTPFRWIRVVGTVTALTGYTGFMMKSLSQMNIF